MQSQIQCPCGQALQVDVPPGGAQVKCPSCNSMLAVQDPAAGQAAAPQPNPLSAGQSQPNPFTGTPPAGAPGAPNRYVQSPYQQQRAKQGSKQRSAMPLVLGAVAAVGLLLICVVGVFVAFSGDRKAKVPAAAPSTSKFAGKKVPAAAAKPVAMQFERAAKAPGAAQLEAMIKYDLIVDKAIAGFELSATQKSQFKTGLIRGMRQNSLGAELKRGGNVITFLRMREKDGITTALFRIAVGNDGGIGYVETGFGYSPSGTVVINDVFTYATAEWLSQTLRKRTLPVVAEMNKSFFQRLGNKADNDFIKHGSTISRVASQGHARPAWALREIKKLPASLQKDKSVLVMRITFASATNDDSEYLSAIEAMRRAYPNDPAQKLFVVDYYFLKKQNQKACEAIRELDKMVGGDPALGVLEAATHSVDNRMDLAKVALARSLKQDPNYQDAIDTANALGISIAELGVGGSTVAANPRISNPAPPRDKPNPFGVQSSPNDAKNPFSGGVVEENLLQARGKFRTRLIKHERNGSAVPSPPAKFAKKVKYRAQNGMMDAYVTNRPAGSQLNPAIIWISGGDCNTIDDGFFDDASADNDQTASMFWRSGIITMYPSLRGGNRNPGFREAFFGEVNDVLAARDYLEKQPGVDPKRIYLGGHSTGGTLVLLVAASTDKFRAVFSFGPAENVRGYGADSIPFDSSNPNEFKLRDPINWISSIKSPTFVIEGAQQPGNILSLLKIKTRSSNTPVQCFTAGRYDHFSVLGPTSQRLAVKIKTDSGSGTFTMSQREIGL